MTPFLARRWFLLALLLGVGLAGLRPEDLHQATRFLEPRLVVAPALFLMAWTLESRGLVRSLARPLPALWAVALSYGLVPASAWLASPLLPVPDLRIGLFIMAGVPCTLASAVLWTRLAGGDEAIALLVVLLTTSSSWLVTTGWLFLATGQAVALDPASLMRDLALVLVVPVAVGQLCRAVPLLLRVATRYKAMLGVLSQLLVLAIILRAAVDVSLGLRQQRLPVSAAALLLAAVVCAGIHLGVLAAGWWSGRVLRFDRGRRIAVAFSCSQKTLPVALYLFDAHYKDAYPLAVVPLACYHVGQLVLDTFIADRFRRREQLKGGMHEPRRRAGPGPGVHEEPEPGEAHAGG